MTMLTILVGLVIALENNLFFREKFYLGFNKQFTLMIEFLNLSLFNDFEVIAS